MTEKLLPCPFCGPGESVVSLYFDDVAKRHRVGCGRCGASTGIHPRSRRSEHAVKAWSRRRGQPIVPEGWKLVPVEPTDDMALAACRVGWRNPAINGVAQYKAMLEAAPKFGEEE